MNYAINQPNSLQPYKNHPYEALMTGLPGVVSMYLLDLNQKDFPYVEVYTEDPRRLNMQSDRLRGKPYNWHGICSAIRAPRVHAINELIKLALNVGSYSYKYWDKGTRWEFNCRLSRLPYDYLLLTVADAHDWQKHFWTPGSQPLESLNADDDDDDDDDIDA